MAPVVTTTTTTTTDKIVGVFLTRHKCVDDKKKHVWKVETGEIEPFQLYPPGPSVSAIFAQMLVVTGHTANNQTLFTSTLPYARSKMRCHDAFWCELPLLILSLLRRNG